jgi:hypothetical protein
MAKFRAMLGDRFLDVDADSTEAAQEAAFALFVARLKPQDFTVWPTDEADEWRKYLTEANPDAEGK